MEGDDKDRALRYDREEEEWEEEEWEEEECEEEYQDEQDGVLEIDSSAPSETQAQANTFSACYCTHCMFGRGCMGECPCTNCSLERGEPFETAIKKTIECNLSEWHQRQRDARWDKQCKQERDEKIALGEIPPLPRLFLLPDRSDPALRIPPEQLQPRVLGPRDPEYWEGPARTVEMARASDALEAANFRANRSREGPAPTAEMARASSHIFSWY